MTDDDRLGDLLRTAFPPIGGARPRRDLWPLVVDRVDRRAHWSWIDLALAAAVLLTLLVFPKSLLLLAYHL